MCDATKCSNPSVAQSCAQEAPQATPARPLYANPPIIYYSPIPQPPPTESLKPSSPYDSPSVPQLDPIAHPPYVFPTVYSPSPILQPVDSPAQAPYIFPSVYSGPPTPTIQGNFIPYVGVGDSQGPNTPLFQFLPAMGSQFHPACYYDDSTSLQYPASLLSGHQGSSCPSSPALTSPLFMPVSSQVFFPSSLPPPCSPVVPQVPTAPLQHQLQPQWPLTPRPAPKRMAPVNKYMEKSIGKLSSNPCHHTEKHELQVPASSQGHSPSSQSPHHRGHQGISIFNSPFKRFTLFNGTPARASFPLRHPTPERAWTHASWRDTSQDTEEMVEADGKGIGHSVLCMGEDRSLKLDCTKTPDVVRECQLTREMEKANIQD